MDDNRGIYNNVNIFLFINMFIGILVYAFILYCIIEIVIFSLFWENKFIQTFLKKDFKYGDSCVSFIAITYPFARAYKKIRLYNDFMIISGFLKKIKIQKSYDKISIISDLPKRLFNKEPQLIRVYDNKQATEYIITKKQADIIYNWLRNNSIGE